MPDMTEMEFEDLETWKKPAGKSFAEWMESRVARFETNLRLGCLKFQADYDPKYARAQCRYMGTGVGVSNDEKWCPQNILHFRRWFCLQAVRALHTACRCGRIFFMLKGSIRLTIEDDEIFMKPF